MGHAAREPADGLHLLRLLELLFERPHAGDVGGQAHDSRHLTRQLLLFCRHEAIEPRVLDVNHTIEGLQRMVQRIVGEDVLLSTDRMRATWRIHADPGHVEQVILNLVVNARDAMPGGGTLTVETADVLLDDSYCSTLLPAKPGPYVMISVADTGCGIDQATQSRIFEPFFTTKERGKGNGLGLSTVFGVVQRGGGTIRVKSEPGRGATFEIYLPRVDGEVGQEAVPVARDAGACHGKILVVDDDVAVGQVVARSVRHRGYDVVRVDGPRAALDLVANASEAFDFLLTDVVMPQMDGPSLAEKAVAAQPEMKVVFMSGYADDSAARTALMVSGAIFLSKPFTPDALANKVTSVLR